MTSHTPSQPLTTFTQSDCHCLQRSLHSLLPNGIHKCRLVDCSVPFVMVPLLSVQVYHSCLLSEVEEANLTEDFEVHFHTAHNPSCVVSVSKGKEPSVRQLALLHFRNIITLNIKLEDALSRSRARVPPSIIQMLLILQVNWLLFSSFFLFLSVLYCWSRLRQSLILLIHWKLLPQNARVSAQLNVVLMSRRGSGFMPLRSRGFESKDSLWSCGPWNRKFCKQTSVCGNKWLPLNAACCCISSSGYDASHHIWSTQQTGCSVYGWVTVIFGHWNQSHCYKNAKTRCCYLPSVLDYLALVVVRRNKKRVLGKVKVFFCLIKEKHELVLGRGMRQKGTREPGGDS